MRSGTRKKNEKKRNRGGLDMAAKALAEYEEAERRRYHERLRAERKGAPMEITQEDRERVMAMAFIDIVNEQYLELVRTGHCPSCEQIVEWKQVEKNPHHEMLDDLAGDEASGYLQWTSEHLEDCRFASAYQILPEAAARYHIVVVLQQVDIGKRPDGKVTRDLFPVRIPAAGDPPVGGLVEAFDAEMERLLKRSPEEDDPE